MFARIPQFLFTRCEESKLNSFVRSRLFTTREQKSYALSNHEVTSISSTSTKTNFVTKLERQNASKSWKLTKVLYNKSTIFFSRYTFNQPVRGYVKIKISVPGIRSNSIVLNNPYNSYTVCGAGRKSDTPSGNQMRDWRSLMPISICSQTSWIG